jgi:hypothetical protein
MFQLSPVRATGTGRAACYELRVGMNARVLRLGVAVLVVAAACGGSVASPRSSTATDAGSDASGSSSGAAPGTDSGSSSGASDGGPSSDVHESGTVDEPPPPCAAPTFSPPSGTANAGDITLSDPDVTGPSGFIFYTFDGTNPTVNSPVYSGPIQLTLSTTFRAAAQNLPACAMSPITTASYPIDPPDCCGGPYLPPVLTPGSKISDNDFLVQATGQVGSETLCYTVDGTAPTCDASAQCTGTSQTYNAANRIAIDGKITNVSTGQVTVQVVGCMVGWSPSTIASQTYTLQADAPTMTSPSPATTFAADAGAVTPTLASGTLSSLSPANAVSIQTTTGSAAAPTCSSGTANANPTVLSITSDTSIQALTCKSGYLPSAVVTFDYAFAP